MLRLQLFGGLSLLKETELPPGPATQRRRLALLARVAASPHGSISRDKLIGCFWPEEDRERARHYLADSVFTLRKHLGKDAIVTVGDDLLLSPQAFDCDLWQFLRAVDEGYAERAVTFYAGPFLDGFFVGDAPGFEHWVEEERTRLAGMYAAALEVLAEESERRKDPGHAVHWWRRLAIHDPFNSRVALRYMQTLAASGDRATAVQYAKVHAALLRGELGVEADPAIGKLAAQLTATSAVSSSAAAASLGINSPSSAGEADPAAVPLVDLGDIEAARPISPYAAPESPPAAALPSKPSRWRRRPQAFTFIPLLLLTLAAGTALWRSGRLIWIDPTAAAGARPIEATVVAVLPFSYRGTPEYAYLGEGFVQLLSTSLDGAGNVRSVDTYAILNQTPTGSGRSQLPPGEAAALAASLGANAFILGNVFESGGRLQVAASFYSMDGELRLVGSWSADGTDEWEVVNELYRQILENALLDPADRVRQLAVRTSSSGSALKAYLQGEEEFRAARYQEAAAALQRAVEEDPSFAIAHYRLSTAAAWNFDFEEARVAAEQAQRLSKDLSQRDERLIAAWHAFVTGEPDEAERLYELVLTADPLNVEAWSGLGEVRVHYHGLHGRRINEAIPAFQEVLRLAPRYGEARFHLLEFAASDGNRVLFDSLLGGVDPHSPQTLSWQAARALAWGSAGEADSAMAQLKDAEDVVVGIAAVRLAANFRDLSAAQSVTRLLTRPERPAKWRAAGHIMSAQGHLARGEWEEARAELARSMPLEPDWTLEIRGLAALLPKAPEDAEELRELTRLLGEWNPRAAIPDATFFFATHADVHSHLRHYLLALISLRLGDEETAGEHAEELRRAGGSSTRGELARSLYLSVAAHQAWRRGQGDQALRLLQNAEMRAPFERAALSPFFARALDRHLRAEILTALDRPEEALRWYGSLSEGPDLLFWASAHRHQSDLRGRLEQWNEARRHDAQFRALWRGQPEGTGSWQ